MRKIRKSCERGTSRSEPVGADLDAELTSKANDQLCLVFLARADSARQLRRDLIRTQMTICDELTPDRGFALSIRLQADFCSGTGHI